ncbi:zinc-finger associated domain (zf-AD) domain-containing protein [Phthorimaea operculella]|nr:zinc-finger associated domain (zf-AD) domain-containing protein [Phthorimaea operculella]
MCENVQNCCRICLDAESDHVSILGDPTIQLHMKSCLAMTVSANDHLPKKVCTSCVAQLNDFYNFQLNARCSLDWLEYNVEEQAKKSSEPKLPIQPLPDSEYNSDSLLEFLNNTANIEEYLNNLGKEDIPSIVNMLDRNQENSLDGTTKITNIIKPTKQPSPKKKDNVKTKTCIKMEIDVLDSDVEIVKELIKKEIEPKKTSQLKDKNQFICFACKAKFDNMHKMSQHLTICDYALRTCSQCNLLFDSRFKMLQHSLIHSKPLTCNCGKQFPTREKLNQHHKACHNDNTSKNCLFRCKQCKETFKERFQLYKHAKEHVLKMEEKICDICGQVLIGHDALVKHSKDVHGKDPDTLYRCKICQHTSANRSEIYLHIQNRCLPPAPQDRHLCESCGRSFTTKASLLRHVSLHITEYKCSICKKPFSDVKSRDDHVLGHIEMTICEKCGQNVSSYKLEGHSCV